MKDVPISPATPFTPSLSQMKTQPQLLSRSESVSRLVEADVIVNYEMGVLFN